MIKFIEKDVKRACKKSFSFFITQKFLNKVRSLNIVVTGESISLLDLELFPNLEDLYIDKQDGTYEIKDIDVIYKCKNLKTLTISRCKPFYLPINYFQNVEELDFYDTEIEDFYFLRGMPKLTDLVLIGENVKDIGFLKNLPSLEYLSLEETSVKDISPIKYLEKLESIEFEDNKLIKDYSIIKTLPSVLNYYINGEYYDKDNEYIKEEETDNYEVKDCCGENKKKNIPKRDTKKIIFFVLAPIFYLIIFLIIMLGIMKLPNIVPAFFRSSRVGNVKSILYPTIICNGALAIGLTLGCIGVAIGNIKWFKKLIRVVNNDIEAEKLGFNRQNIFSMAILCVISIGFSIFLTIAILSSEGIIDIISRNVKDLKIYNSGNGVKYYGTLQLKKSYGRMEGVYYTGNYSQFKKYLTAVEFPHQGWRAGKNFSLVCPITLSRNLKLEKNTDYLVKYLPNTKIVYSIEKLDRWDYINDVLENNLFGKKMDISSDEILSGIYTKGQYLEKNYPIIKEILSGKEKYKIEYSKTDLNGDGENDYLVVLKNKSGKKVIMGIIMIDKKYQEIFLPEIAGDENSDISKLSTKTYYLYDLKVVSSITGEESVLQFDGKKSYIRSSRKK